MTSRVDTECNHQLSAAACLGSPSRLFCLPVSSLAARSNGVPALPLEFRADLSPTSPVSYVSSSLHTLAHRTKMVAHKKRETVRPRRGAYLEATKVSGLRMGFD